MDLPVILPGTTVVHEEGGGSHDEIRSTQLRLPRPWRCLEDPLNWSTKWKYLVALTQFLYLFVSVESALSMGPMFPLFAAEFNLEGTELNLLTGACVLALAFANFIIVPCSNIFGRRFASLLFCLIGIASCIWQAMAASYGSLFAGRVVNGVATATSETLMIQVIIDLFSLHERGLWVGIYFIGYFLGLFIGPIISGNIGQKFGWRVFFWLSLAMSGFNFLTLLLICPETKFIRPAEPDDYYDQHEAIQSDFHKHQDQHIEHTNPQDDWKAQGRPCRAQFKLWQMPEMDWKSRIFRDLSTPFLLFPFPIVIWAALNVAGPANVLLYWNLTESTVLSAAPYGFSPSAVGYANFAFVIGGLIGLVTAGPLSDFIVRKATRRNNGVYEAEMRLPALIPFFFTSLLGIIIGGFGYEKKWDWPYILVLGYGLSGLCVTSVPTIAITYAVDCYECVPGEIMAVATMVKNTCGFVMSYWVPSLADRKGYLMTTMVEMALTIGPLLLGFPLYFWGKRLRHATRKSRVHSYNA